MASCLQMFGQKLIASERTSTPYNIIHTRTHTQSSENLICSFLARRRRKKGDCTTDIDDTSFWPSAKVLKKIKELLKERGPQDTIFEQRHLKRQEIISFCVRMRGMSKDANANAPLSLIAITSWS